MPGVDNPAWYRTVTAPNGAIYLERSADGACVYVTDAGCSLHETTKPLACRAYDCRDDIGAEGIPAEVASAAERRRNE